MMKLSDFKIGQSFYIKGVNGPCEILCSDIGTRVVVGVRIEDISVTHVDNGVTTQHIIPKEQARKEGWFVPMMGCKEHVFDPDDFQVCYKTVQECEENS